MTTEMVDRRQRRRPESGDVDTVEVAPTSTPARAIARVDLVPPSVEARRKNAATERKLVAGVLAALVVVVVAALAIAMLAVAAESNLSAERTRSQVLLNEQKQYTELSGVKAQLGAYDGAELAALYSEADWARLMTELDTVLPDDIMIASEAIAVKGVSEGAAKIETTGLDAPGVIEITFTATAATFDSPTPLLNALSKLTGYVSATVNAVAAEGETGYVITGVVQLNAEALGGTARVAVLDPEQIAALHDQLELAATTSPDAGATAGTTDTTKPGE